MELRAYVHRVARSLVAFEWDLIANNAFLQISQLPRGFDYDAVANEFLSMFRPLTRPSNRLGTIKGTEAR